MKQTTTKYKCDRCRKEYDLDELIISQTNNVYEKRGSASFSRSYQWRDIGGDHVSEEAVDLCASCAELVERVITGTRQVRGS